MGRGDKGKLKTYGTTGYEFPPFRKRQGAQTGEDALPDRFGGSDIWTHPPERASGTTRAKGEAHLPPVRDAIDMEGVSIGGSYDVFQCVVHAGIGHSILHQSQALRDTPNVRIDR